MRFPTPLVSIILASLIAVGASVDRVHAQSSHSTGSAQGEATAEQGQIASPSWDGVGRLEFSNGSFCTGALISPWLVLTVAHCLFDVESGLQMAAADIEFRAGWRTGRASAYRAGAHTVIHPDYNYNATRNTEHMLVDLALIELEHPIENASIQPFGLGQVPYEGDTVSVVSYAHDRSDAPSLQPACDVLAQQNGILVMTCDADFGASGSPVFQIGPDGIPKIVSVLSAKALANGAPVSLATPAEKGVLTLKSVWKSATEIPARSAQLLESTDAEPVSP